MLVEVGFSAVVSDPSVGFGKEPETGEEDRPYVDGGCFEGMRVPFAVVLDVLIDRQEGVTGEVASCCVRILLRRLIFGGGIGCFVNKTRTVRLVR